MVTSDSVLVNKLNRLVDDHLDKPSFSIDTICQLLGISRSQLHRTVKEHTGLSTSLYVRKRRLLKAHHLLTSTDLRISEISDQVGFSTAQNFSTYFTEEFGLSPSEFRKKAFSSAEPVAQTEQADLVSPVTDVLFADVTPAETIPLPVVETVSIARPNRRGRPDRLLVYIGMVVSLLAGLSLGWYSWRRHESASLPPRAVNHSLAVLPFLNMGNADSSPACEGIMSEIHTSVSHIKNLTVIARSSSDQYQGTKKSIWQIGDELQVENLLKGSVLKTGDQVQIRVELINTRDDIRTWSQTYEAAYTNIFKLTDQIVRDVAVQLEQKLTPTEAVQLDRLPTQNLEAYGEYVKGKHLMLARTNEKLRASLDKFNRAIALDDSFADAYAARASAYLVMSDFGVLDKTNGLRQAEANALEAIRLDGTNGTAYGVLGNLYRLQNKWDQALLTFQIALKHSPNDPQINFWYGIALRSIGRFEEAIRYETKAVTLSPLYPAALIGLISTCANAGRHDLALKAIRDGEPLFNDAYLYHYARSFYHLTLGEYPQAVAAMRVSDSLSHSVNSLRYYRLYLRGRTRPRESFLAELQPIASAPENYVDLAYAYAGMQDRERCLQYLQLAADQNHTPDYLKVTPLFAFLHGDPRFTAILRQHNLISP